MNAPKKKAPKKGANKSAAASNDGKKDHTLCRLDIATP